MKLLQNLIGINSISGNESKIQAYVGSYIAQLGLKPIVFKGNTIVKISGQDTSKALIFNVHVDTVAVGDLTSWKYDPFQGKIRAGRVYGLGASDEKATVAVLLRLAENLVADQPTCDVWLHFVNNEEVSGQGTKDCLDWFVANTTYKEVAGILGEPTNLKTIEVAHRGNAFVKVTTNGDSGHSSDPSVIKKHAVLDMISFMQKVENLGKVWEEKYSDEILGQPSIGLYTSINAGSSESPNKFPTSCTATLDVRTTPKLHKKVLQDIADLSNRVKVEYAFASLPYGYTDPHVRIVKVAQKTTQAMLGMSTWSNDLCFFTEKNIPAIVYGPGSKEKIHNSNEYCEIEKIELCIEQYQRMIEEFTQS